MLVGEKLQSRHGIGCRGVSRVVVGCCLLVVGVVLVIVIIDCWLLDVGC